MTSEYYANVTILSDNDTEEDNLIINNNNKVDTSVLLCCICHSFVKIVLNSLEHYHFVKQK